MPSAQALRIVEALLFAASEPMEEGRLLERLPEGADIGQVLRALQAAYSERGVNLVHVGKGWAFRTAPDLGDLLKIETQVTRKLSKAAVETLAVIAYHQPVTRAEIEEIRGVGQSKGTLDVLFEAGWVKPGRRRKTPGRPVTWVTTQGFLDHFGLERIEDLPGVAELRASGLLDSRPAIQAFRASELDPDDLLTDEPPGSDDDEDLEEERLAMLEEELASDDEDEEEDVAEPGRGS